jgi:hypothetical protein
MTITQKYGMTNDWEWWGLLLRLLFVTITL